MDIIKSKSRRNLPSYFFFAPPIASGIFLLITGYVALRTRELADIVLCISALVVVILQLREAIQNYRNAKLVALMREADKLHIKFIELMRGEKRKLSETNASDACK